MSDDTFDPDDMNNADWPAVRASLRDVAAPVAAREAAIAAALDVFDELQATPATVVSLASRRKRQYRMLSYAAAAVAVLFVGGAIVRGLRTTPNPTMSASEKEATAAPALASTNEPQPDGQALPQTVNGGAATEAPPPVEASPTTAASDSTRVAAIATIGSISGPADAGTTAAANTGSTDLVSTEAVVAIDSPQALASYARTLTSPARVQGAPCVPSSAEALGTVSYQGHLAVVRRAPDGTISAVDAASCAVLASTAP